jgi:S-adenosylmethionine-dependent methyltransferase
MPPSTVFTPGEEEWRARLGTLRQVVRQELVSRQLARHLPAQAGLRVLDLGCGQGTQVLRLARGGHLVTGLDSSRTLLADLRRALRAEPLGVADRVRVVHGDVRAAAALVDAASFDVVMCHGVLMYLPDPGLVLEAVAAMAAPGGIVSLLVRNGDALAMRPGLQGNWAEAAAAFGGTAYRNRLGITARADRLGDLTVRLVARQLAVLEWYGVRVFTDLAGDDTPVPDPGTLARILDCEERAGRSDPYRAVAPLLHVVAQRPAAGGDVTGAPPAAPPSGEAARGHSPSGSS